MRRYLAALYKPFKVRLTRLKLDLSADARRRLVANMLRVYLELHKRYLASHKQGTLLSTEFGMVNPGILLNKSLSSSNIKGLPDEAIIDLAANSPDLPDRDLYPLRTLPIATWIVAKEGIRKLTYKKLRDVFDRAMDIHLDLQRRGLPRRHPENISQIIINTGSIDVLVKSGLWRRLTATGSRRIKIIDEFGEPVTVLEGNAPLETGPGYVWSK